MLGPLAEAEPVGRHGIARQPYRSYSVAAPASGSAPRQGPGRQLLLASVPPRQSLAPALLQSCTGLQLPCLCCRWKGRTGTGRDVRARLESRVPNRGPSPRRAIPPPLHPKPATGERAHGTTTPPVQPCKCNANSVSCSPHVCGGHHQRFSAEASSHAICKHRRAAMHCCSLTLLRPYVSSA